MIVPALAKRLLVVQFERLPRRRQQALCPAVDADPAALGVVDQLAHAHGYVAGRDPSGVPAAPVLRVCQGCGSSVSSISPGSRYSSSIVTQSARQLHGWLERQSIIPPA